MIKKIFGTALTRVFAAILSFFILIINARELGAANIGTISLIILAITITMLVSSFMGGGALVYLVPRQDVFQLLFVSYSWTFISSAMCAVLLTEFNLIPEGFTFHVLLLSLFQGFYNINNGILLGKEKVKSFNIISIFQILSLFLFVVYFIQIRQNHDVIWYIFALYFSYLLAFFLSFISIYKYLIIKGFDNVERIIAESIKFGTYVQLAALAQMLNYRLSYYILERYFGKATLGIFSVGTQISEGIWLVGKSVATVQYSAISNNPDFQKSVKLTMSLFKFVFIITLTLLLMLVSVPQSWFVALLKKDFSEINTIILYLSPGILAMSVSMILSHFFSGTGKHYHNSISSGIGLMVTLVCGFTLIPIYGITGAALTASFSYTISAIYQLIVFIRISKIKMRELLIRKSDFLILKQIVGKSLKVN